MPFELPTLEQQTEKCQRWSKRKSPDGKEIWLNWAGCEKSSEQLMGHFQVGIKEDSTASIGYIVSKNFQGKGYATEAMET